MSRHLAIDIGASGGKAFIGEFSGGSLELTEVNRFQNGPIEIEGRMRWDMLVLIEHVRDSVRTALDYTEGHLDTMGIDTWGVDLGFIDEEGDFMEDPIAYRDPGVSATVDEVYKLIPKRELFDRTGIQHLPFNTIFQLHSYFNKRREIGNPGRMLLMPGLLTHLAGGTPAVDATIASTTQLIDIRTGNWAFDIAELLDIPRGIFPEIVPPGTIAGNLEGPIGVGLNSDCTVVHSAGHDTASAVASFDFGEEDAAYLSTGSWFLAGCLSTEPLLSDEAYEAGLTNERGADGRYRVLKNVTGLYLMQECQAAWAEQGMESDTVRLVEMAAESEPFGPMFDPDHESLSTTGDMPDKIRALLERTGKPVPGTQGELLRCIFESIAVKTSIVLRKIFGVAGITPATLHLGGGGARNELLCRMIAGATGMNVEAGPVEAAAVGNIIVQAVAMGAIGSIAEGAKIAGQSLPVEMYTPGDISDWADARRRFARF